MNRLLKILVVVFLALLMVTPLGAADRTKVKVGVSPFISTAGFFLAKERGYFDQQGLDVELIQMAQSGPEILPLLAADTIQVGGGSVSPALYNAIAEGIGVKVVADKASIDPRQSHDALLVRTDLLASGRYKTGADLKGMTVAANSPGVTSVLVIGLERYLKKFNLTLSDIKLVTVPPTEQLVAFSGKQIDAALSIEPFVAKCEAENAAKRVAGFEESIPDYQVAAVFYGDKFIKEKPEAAKKFMVAYVKGLRDYVDAFRYGKNFDKTVDDLIKHLNVKDRALYKKMRVTGFNPDGYVDKPSITDSQNWWAAKGLIKTKVPVEKVVDDSFCDYAVSVLGKYQPPAK